MTATGDRRTLDCGHTARSPVSTAKGDAMPLYCLYEAPNPEALRKAAAVLGIPADVIVEVDQYVPSTA